MITFDSFKIDLAADEWHFAKEEAPTRLWVNPYRDFMQQRLVLAAPPDLPPDYPNIESQRAFFQQVSPQTNSAVISVESLSIQGIEGFSTLFKFRSPKHPTGYLYLGTMMFTFDSFFCGFQFQADEHPDGVSGTREATVYILLKGKDKLPSEVVEAANQPPRAFKTMNEFFDEVKAVPTSRHFADDEQYDEMFPDHQLSRVRRYMKRVTETINFDDEVKRAKPFRGPAWKPAR